MGYLDNTGLTHLWDKIKAAFGSTLEVSGKTVTLKSKSGATLSTITTQDTTYSAATTSANGLMSSSDKTKLNGIATGANNYSLPTATSSVLGGVKTGDNITNTSGVISLTKTNVTNALGYTPPTTNTTYSVATTSANGLMSSGDKSKLDGIATGATANTGTLTGIKMNGASKGTSGVVDLGTVITSHQDISGKQDKLTAGSNITISGSTISATNTNDKVTQTAVGDTYTNWRPLVIGSSNSSTEGFTPTTVTDTTFTTSKISVQPSSGTVKATNFKGNVNGYSIAKSVPSDAKFTDTTYSAATTSANGLMSSGDKSKLNGIATGATKNSITTATATLTVAGWSSKSQTVSVSGVTTSNLVFVSPNNAGVKCTAQGSGTLTFTCDTVPTANVSVSVAIMS